MKRFYALLLAAVLLLSAVPLVNAAAFTITLPKKIEAGKTFAFDWDMAGNETSYTVILSQGKTRLGMWKTTGHSYSINGKLISAPGTYTLTVRAMKGDTVVDSASVDFYAVGDGPTAPPVTDPPAPVTDPPVPVTAPPVTAPPAPVTDPPVPFTAPPVTNPPAPVTDPPVPAELPQIILYGQNTIKPGEDMDLNWTNVGFGAVYSLSIVNPYGYQVYNWVNLTVTSYHIPGAVFTEEGTYVLEITATLGGKTGNGHGLVHVQKGVTAPPYSSSSVRSVLYGGSEVIGKYRYATANGEKSFTVVTDSQYDTVIAWVDGSCVYYGMGSVARSGKYWGHSFTITFSVGFHTVEFAVAGGTGSVSGSVASPAGTSAQTMYMGYGAYLYSWPKDGYQTSRYLPAGTQVTLRGNLNGFDYITYGSTYYFVKTGVLSYGGYDPYVPYDPYDYYNTEHEHFYVNGYCLYCGAAQPKATTPPPANTGTAVIRKDGITIQPGETVAVKGSQALYTVMGQDLTMLYDSRIIKVAISGGGLNVTALKVGESRLYVTYKGMEVINTQVKVTTVTPAPSPTPIPQVPVQEVPVQEAPAASGADAKAIPEDIAQFDSFRAILVENGVDPSRIATDDDLRRMLEMVDEETGIYPALANVIMKAYEGREDAFSAAFGYDRLYNGQPNYTLLMTDLYFSLEDIDLKDPEGCLRDFSLKNGNAYQVSSVYVYTVPMTAGDYNSCAVQQIQILLRLRAAAGREYIPYLATADTWSCRVLESGKYCYLTATGVLEGNQCAVLNGDAAARLGQAVPASEMKTLLDGKDGVYSEAFLQGGSIEYIGLKVTPN